MKAVNRQWRVRRHPAPGERIGPEHFVLGEAAIPEAGEGEILVRTLALGTSPAQRGYVDPRKPDIVPVGGVMRGRGIGVVEASRHPGYAVGDRVSASTGWQEWSVQRPGLGPVQSMDVLGLMRVDPEGPPERLLGTLGAAGYTALHGLVDIGAARSGDTVVVTAAAGGVGSMACQVARALGCRVVGIAGTAEKCRWLRDALGVDAAIDYRSEDVGAMLDRHCPDGIDVFFDNVGGAVLDTALERIAVGARVVICGYIAIDYLPERPPGPRHYTRLLLRRARMEGFVIWDQRERYPEFHERLKGWYEAGRLRAVEDVSEGLESMPGALRALFTGANTGVKVVRVAAVA